MTVVDRRWLSRALATAVIVLSLADFAHIGTRPLDDFATRYAGGVVTSRGISPYDLTAESHVERRLVGFDLEYPFRDPPPVAELFRVVSAIPYAAAQWCWIGLSILCSAVCALLAARAVGLDGATPGYALFVLAVGLTFAPLRNAIAEGQIDPVFSALALMSLGVLGAGVGGVIQAIAALKPQATLLASAGGLARRTSSARYAVGILGGFAALVIVTRLAHGPGWERWLHVVYHVAHPTKLKLAAGVVALCLVAALTYAGWRRLTTRGIEQGLAAFALASCANAVLGPFVFLNSQSEALMLVPLGVLAVATLGPASQVLFGIAAGIFFVDGLFSITFYTGYAHAALPLLIATLLAGAAVIRFPRLVTAILTAYVVNVVITLPKLSPMIHTRLSVAAALVVLSLLAITCEDKDTTQARRAQGEGA